MYLEHRMENMIEEAKIVGIWMNEVLNRCLSTKNYKNNDITSKYELKDNFESYFIFYKRNLIMKCFITVNNYFMFNSILTNGVYQNNIKIDDIIYQKIEGIETLDEVFQLQTIFTDDKVLFKLLVLSMLSIDDGMILKDTNLMSIFHFIDKGLGTELVQKYL